MAESRSRGLGRGLSALLAEADTSHNAAAAATSADEPARGAPVEAAIELLRRNPNQPRRAFAEADLDELAASIGERGVLQPILVRPAPGAEGEWQIVAGERRWRAAQRAGLTSVPILIRDLDDLEMLEVAIIENVQRADLNAVEEAQGYKALVERFGRTQEDVARTVGKSRSHVANALRLLHLPEAVQDHLTSGRLSAGHARAIAGAKDPVALARRIVDDGLNVRQAEALAKQRASEAAAEAPRPKRGDDDVRALEHDLEEVLGLSVEVRDRGGRGELRLKYGSLEQLDDLCRRLTQRPS